MFLGRATYRVQLHRDFTFKDLSKIIPYLDRLGISTIYAAPFFKATPGSMHGYDVLDPLQINPEIGTLEELQEIAQDLKARNMNWLQDIVPNHMAFSSQNPWIYDVMEKGIHSPFYRFFDINWLYPDGRFYGKLMVPTLGASLEQILQNREISLQFTEKGFVFSYYDHIFPASMRSYVYLTNQASDKMIKAGKEDEDSQKFLSLAQRLDDFIRTLPDAEKAVDGWDSLKDELLELSSKYEQIKAALEDTAKDISQSDDKLKELLEGQYFRLTHWQTTEHTISYRRFFTVNDLICLNMQEDKVFETYHRFIKKLLDDDLVQGLRVDHVDGLLDPSSYLEKLRHLAGDEPYLTVEKILEGEEMMPDFWPVAGSSGYDFLAMVNKILTSGEGSQHLLEFYREKIHEGADYHDLVYHNKIFILKNRMAGELENLCRLMEELDIIPHADATPDREKLKEALGHFLVAFPVYRVYSNRLPFTDEDMEIISKAFSEAEEKAPHLSEYFQRLREIFNGVDDKSEEENRNKLYFSLRSQQFSGPLAAKGVEDTTFYQYFPLISHNEVGDSPEKLGADINIFHQQLRHRALHTMNATATHDTKRGEDARLRINLLSEIPTQWTSAVVKWQYLNEAYLTKEEGRQMPDANDEYFFYQTLIGTYPFHINPQQENYQQRIKDYLIKAVREAKVHSNWTTPNEAYEKAFMHFADQVINSKKFMAEFEAFLRPLVRSATVYSLVQTLVKITAPGMPDIYQGTEFWDLSMVDPDNRRPVNYEDREKVLNEMEASWQQDPEELLESLKNDLLDPRIKLFTLYQSLNARKLYRPIFDEGTYEPVNTELATENSLLAFRRQSAHGQALVVVPLNLYSLNTEKHLPLGEAAWHDSKILLGEEAGEWHHVFTNKKIKLAAEAPVAEILAEFPVAMLIKS